MATQITFTDDVGRIATASNADGSIRWHVYERPFGQGTSVFVQREVNGSLQAEVRLLSEGERPEVFFDEANSRWLIFYVLNESAFLITADENDAPATQPPQTGTTRDALRPGPGIGNPNDFATREFDSIPFGAERIAYNGPPDIRQFGVGAGPGAPGTNFAVVFQPEASPTTNRNLNIAGFRVLRQDFSGRVEDVTPGGFIPFVGFRTYEAVVPAVPGRYVVVQDNFRGDATSQLVRGRPIPPTDEAFSDGLTADFALSRTLPRLGLGLQDNGDLGFIFVDASPVVIIRGDAFPTRNGTSDNISEIQFVQFTPVAPIIRNDTLLTRVGEGFQVLLTQTGQGGVIIG
jgi:hypothetical protein